MAWLVIPTTPGVPFQRSKVTLEGRDYVLDLSWNMREERWYLSLLDNESNPLVMGRKLATPAVSLLRGKHYLSTIPPGQLCVGNLSGQGGPPGLDDLGPGLRCELLYRESTT